ncbi:hypothetical protein CMUS01_13530 [Colletotrichum musicola]|uniref:Uncharacterized protein n=1 Tax=Colletotrichum musicola TaxID=2175873 RepID=A0A8H6JBP0_9PEZI|nr:hypothetical protein CMUS01_13530 [Colletotrichum musicola]
MDRHPNVGPRDQGPVHRKRDSYIDRTRIPSIPTFHSSSAINFVNILRNTFSLPSLRITLLSLRLITLVSEDLIYYSLRYNDSVPRYCYTASIPSFC